MKGKLKPNWSRTNKFWWRKNHLEETTFSATSVVQDPTHSWLLRCGGKRHMGSAVNGQKLHFALSDRNLVPVICVLILIISTFHGHKSKKASSETALTGITRRLSKESGLIFKALSGTCTYWKITQPHTSVYDSDLKHWLGYNWLKDWDTWNNA